MRVLKGVYEVVVAFGALACILQYLDVKPKDFGNMLSFPHWIWLAAALTLFAISLTSSIRSYFVYSRLVPELERKLAEEMSAKENREGRLNELRIHHDILQTQLDDERRIARENLQEIAQHIRRVAELETEKAARLNMESLVAKDGTAAGELERKLLANAPRFIVQCRADKERRLTLTNDGVSAAVNVEISPLIHRELHAVQVLFSPFGSMPSKSEETRAVSVANRMPNNTLSFWDVMREATMNPNPEDSVTITFDDSFGNHFCQNFLLTSRMDGSVTWVPGLVKMISPISAVGVEAS